MNKTVLTQLELERIRDFADNDMNTSIVARKTFCHRNTVVYQLEKVKKKTGLDPTCFYDLVQLLGISENPEHVSTYERKKIYNEAVEKYGEEHQLNKFNEELGEFLAEYGRIRNGANNLAAFAEELADLTIMLEQLRFIYGVDDEVSEQMDYKVRRLSGRINGKGDDSDE